MVGEHQEGSAPIPSVICVGESRYVFEGRKAAGVFPDNGVHQFPKISRLNGRFENRMGGIGVLLHAIFSDFLDNTEKHGNQRCNKHPCFEYANGGPYELPYNYISKEQSIPRHGWSRLYRFESVRGGARDGAQGSCVG